MWNGRKDKKTLGYLDRLSGLGGMSDKDKVTLEKWLSDQKTSRTHTHFKTTDRYKQQHLIRQHLADVLLNKFYWNYWVTFTFGHKPYLEEVEDVLYELHKRIDRRLLKHTQGKSIMFPEERSEWFLIPEVGDGYTSNGLHYHAFIRFNIQPNLMGGYKNEWDWVRTAFHQNLEKFNSWITTLDKSQKLEKMFRVYGRSRRNLDNIKMIIYSLKEYGREDFDRFLYTIISHLDWKPTMISQHRTPNKVGTGDTRPNKVFEGSLQNFLV